MANVLYIDGVPWPIGAKVVGDAYGEGEIKDYEIRNMFEVTPLLVLFCSGEEFYCGPNAYVSDYRIRLLTPPAPSETLSDMDEEHNADDEPEATV